jgi:hypothetical protein
MLSPLGRVDVNVQNIVKSRMNYLMEHKRGKLPNKNRVPETGQAFYSDCVLKHTITTNNK